MCVCGRRRKRTGDIPLVVRKRISLPLFINRACSHAKQRRAKDCPSSSLSTPSLVMSLPQHSTLCKHICTSACSFCCNYTLHLNTQLSPALSFLFLFLPHPPTHTHTHTPLYAASSNIKTEWNSSKCDNYWRQNPRNCPGILPPIMHILIHIHTKALSKERGLFVILLLCGLKQTD